MKKEIGIQQTVAATIQLENDIVSPSKKRYVILLIYSMLVLLTSFQAIFLASINDFISNYYRVDHLAINFLSILSMFLTLVLVLPVTWVMERIGIRNSIMIGSFGATCGMLIRCLSYQPDGFLYILAAAAFGTTQLFFSCASSRIATIWFPEHQMTRATSMSVVASELGYALGYVLPSHILGPDPEDVERVGTALLSTYGSLSLLLAITSVTIIFIFDDQPEQAPSLARLKQIKFENEQKFDTFISHMKNQLQLLKSLYSDKNFCVLFIAFGMIEGVNFSFHVILNQIIGAMGSSEVNHANVVSYTGLILIITGILGSLICSYLLDTFQRYKLTTISVYLWTVLTLILFIASLWSGSEPAVYLATSLIGLSITGYSTIGCRYAAEITYPEPELISATLLFLSAHLFGIPISLTASIIVDNYGVLAVGLFYFVILIVGLLSDCFQRGELKRQNAIAIPDFDVISTKI